MNIATASPEELLAELKAERERFTKSNKEHMQALVDRLVELGVYPKSTPAMEEHGYTHLKMVEGWGEDCFTWSEPLNCPNCGHDLRKHESGPPFKKEIGWYEHDMTVAWVCPFCATAFNRFGPQNGELHLSQGQLDRITLAYRKSLEPEEGKE